MKLSFLLCVELEQSNWLKSRKKKLISIGINISQYEIISILNNKQLFIYNQSKNRKVILL